MWVKGLLKVPSFPIMLIKWIALNTTWNQGLILIFFSLSLLTIPNPPKKISWSCWVQSQWQIRWMRGGDFEAGRSFDSTSQNACQKKFIDSNFHFVKGQFCSLPYVFLLVCLSYNPNYYSCIPLDLDMILCCKYLFFFTYSWFWCGKVEYRINRRLKHKESRDDTDSVLHCWNKTS